MKIKIIFILLTILMFGCTPNGNLTSTIEKINESNTSKSSLSLDSVNDEIILNTTPILENESEFRKTDIQTSYCESSISEIKQNLADIDLKVVGKYIETLEHDCGEIADVQVKNEYNILIDKLKSITCTNKSKTLYKQSQNAGKDEHDSLRDDFKELQDECKKIVENRENIREYFEGIDEKLDKLLEEEEKISEELQEICDLYLNRDEINYKFEEYRDFQNHISDEFEELVDNDDVRSYGGFENRYGGSVFFFMYVEGPWDEKTFWAVEVDAKSGDLIKYEDATRADGQSFDIQKMWWQKESRLKSVCN